MTNKVYVPTLAVTVESPYVTKEKFADMCGISLGTVEGWVERGHIQSTKIGTRRLVNLAAETVTAAYREGMLDKIILQTSDTGTRLKEL